MEIFLGIFLDNLLRIKVIWFVKRKIKRRALRIFLEECYQNCIILSVLWPPPPTVFFCWKTFLYRHNAMQGQANNNASFLSTSYTPELNSSLTIFLSFLCIKIESLDILHKRWWVGTNNAIILMHFEELGTRHYFSFATPLPRQRNRSSETSKNLKNVKVLLSKVKLPQRNNNKDMIQ